MIGLLEGSRRVKKKAAENALLLHATVVGCQPKIWRRLHVRESMWLSALHEALQISFEWFDYQTHSFQFEQERYGNPLRRGELVIEDDRDVTLLDIDLARRTRFSYGYHFGEGWQLEILVEKVTGLEKGKRYPSCLAGERAGPPEDCGGLAAFHDMLASLEETGTDMNREWREWIGPDYDPAVFDLTKTNRDLRKVRR
ncbi:MAG TPA: plasmid pRiA4b ORF-3 family protein [Opitutaceae bacterium]|nr:plasmid pRiA4b ORF-3 family protein [Opitutaceae bacterium]